MEIVGLFFLFFFIGLSVVLYIAGILLVDRADLAFQLDQKVQLYYNWVAEHGNTEQKREALGAVERKDLENLQALVGLDLAPH